MAAIGAADRGRRRRATRCRREPPRSSDCFVRRSEDWRARASRGVQTARGAMSAPMQERVLMPTFNRPSIEDPVSYNCRRLEKRNVNEDSDSFYRLHHGRCCLARGLHGHFQELGRVRAVDAKQAGRYFAGYVEGRPSGRGHSRLARGDRRFDRARDNGVGSSGHSGFVRSGCGGFGAWGFGVARVGCWRGVRSFGGVAGLDRVGGGCGCFGRCGCAGSQESLDQVS